MVFKLNIFFNHCKYYNFIIHAGTVSEPQQTSSSLPSTPDTGFSSIQFTSPSLGDTAVFVNQTRTHELLDLTSSFAKGI